MPILCIVSWGCASRVGTLAVSSPPERLGDGWEVAGLAQEALDPARPTALEQSLLAGEYELPDALLIARNGRHVYEQY